MYIYIYVFAWVWNNSFRLITHCCNPFRFHFDPLTFASLPPFVSLSVIPANNLFVFLALFYFFVVSFLALSPPQNTLAWLWQAAVKCSISVRTCVANVYVCTSMYVCVALHMSKSKTISGAKQKLLNVWWSRFAVCDNKIYSYNRSIKNALTHPNTAHTKAKYTVEYNSLETVFFEVKK